MRPPHSHLTSANAASYRKSRLKADLRRRLGTVIAALAALAVFFGLVAVAGAAFSAPVSISAPGQVVIEPQIASDADGDAVAVWSRFDGSTYRVQARTISAAGVLGPIRTLSAAGQYANRPQIASDADGDAVAVWFNGSNYRVQARTISAAGALGPTRTVAQNAFEPQIASDADGDAVAVWSLERSRRGARDLCRRRTRADQDPVRRRAGRPQAPDRERRRWRRRRRLARLRRLLLSHPGAQDLRRRRPRSDQDPVRRRTERLRTPDRERRRRRRGRGLARLRRRV